MAMGVSSPLSAAIVFDNSTNSPPSDFAITGQNTTRHFEIIRDFEVGNFTNRVLVISVTGEGYSSVSQVTFGGSADNAPTNTSEGMVVLTEGWSGGANLTLATTTTTAEPSNSDNAAIFYLFNPTVGLGDIYVEVSEGGDSANFQIGVASFYNVLQQMPTISTGTNTSDVTSATLSINGFAGGVIYDAISVNGDEDNGANPAQSLTSTGGQTTVYNDNSERIGGFSSAAGYELVNADGSQNQTWGYTLASEHAYAAVSFQPVPEPGIAGLAGLAGLTLLLCRRR